MKPKVEVQQSYRKTVTLDITEAMLAEMVKAWLVKNVPQFRGTNIEVVVGCGDYQGCAFSCTATGTKVRVE